MEKLLPYLRKHQKRGQCIPESTISRISREAKISESKIYKKVCYHSPVKESHYEAVKKLLKEKNKHLVAETAPSIRVSIGEEFGYKPGAIVMGKMVAALKALGFNKVFDTNLGADIMIMEEASELLEIIKNKGPFPLLTTCCPAWVRYMEHFNHELIPYMSTCKSPHEMLSFLTKSYYAKKYNINPKNIVMVSIMPCTAKRFESQRPELKSGVDYVLTTKELADLIKEFKINFKSLSEDTEYDSALGISTGAAAIFGATGGVMEAVLRTAYELSTKKQVESLGFDPIRGTRGIKKGNFDINGVKLRCIAANGLTNARKILKNYRNYHFIEIMSCPGGCIGGGGQPQPYSKEKIKARIKGLYQQDINLPIRKAHENPLVKKIYDEFLGKPLSKKSNKLLHTFYYKRKF